MTTSKKGTATASKRRTKVANARKGAKATTTAKRTAAKTPAKRKTSAARKAPGTARAFVHYVEGWSPYQDVRGPAKGAILLAGLIVAGFAKMGAKDSGLSRSGGGGNLALLRQIVGDTAVNHHSPARIDKDAGTLTAVGVEWMNKRLDGTAMQGRTDVDTVREMVKAMTSGGEAGGLKFGREVTVAK